MTGGQRRRSSDDHNHPEYWAREDHFRFEQRMQTELEKIEKAVETLTSRITLMLGGLTLIAILLPVLAPFIRDLFNVPVPISQ